MGNGSVKAQGMEPSFFAVWDYAFIVLKGAGHCGLAVPFEHGHIDHKIHGKGRVTDLDLHPGGVVFLKAVLLKIDKGNLVPFQDRFIACRPQRLCRIGAHPGAFHHGNIRKTVLLQIFNGARHQFRMGRGALGRRTFRHQIGLDADRSLPVPDERLQSGCFQQFFCHFQIVRSMYQINLVFVHNPSAHSKYQAV